MFELYTTKKTCCGCAACVNICPKQAITMKPDEEGFLYPKINVSVCIECGLCQKVCSFQNVSVTVREPLATYVAINKDRSVLSNSASGGVFGALASIVLERKGLVFGCAFNENMEPQHICADNTIDMKKMQGSKYVQSSINTSYIETKRYLKKDRWVLFTGTPCQVAGLKSYLDKDYYNLITADIICHGVPNAAFFNGYIKHLETEFKGKVIDFKFRDKSKGWGFMGKVVYKKNGVVREKYLSPLTSYYYSYFLTGDIYRESCYACKYASAKGESDFTMGDYWGIQKAHPEIETKNGVSVLLVNSEKGMALLDKLNEPLALMKSTFGQAKAQNGQLRQPIAKSDRRESILNMWREGGYKAVADEYYNENKKQIKMFKIKMLLSQSAKKVIKMLGGGNEK